MSIFSLFSKRPVEDLTQKSSRFSTLTYHPVGRPLWTSNHFETQVTNGYCKNPIVYRCVSLLARSVSSIPILLMKEGVKVLDHPVLDLLRIPNPLQSYETFMEALVSNLLLSGNSYVESVGRKDPGEAPAELYGLRPDRLQILPGEKGFPMGYEYHVGAIRHRIQADPVTGHSPIVHLRFFNPLDDWYGLSPLAVAQSAIDLHNTVIGHNVALLQNEGRPSGALIIRNARGLTEAQRTQLRADLDRVYAGKENAGRMMILEGEFEWKEMGFSPKDLDFIEGRNFAAREIAQAFGVPPLCIGLLGDATFTNYREARAHFWEETVLPLWNLIFTRLNQWLGYLFGEPIQIICERDKIEALMLHREKIWDRANTIQCLTLNEKRELLGYAPLPNGDTKPAL